MVSLGMETRGPLVKKCYHDTIIMQLCSLRCTTQKYMHVVFENQPRNLIGSKNFGQRAQRLLHGNVRRLANRHPTLILQKKLLGKCLIKDGIFTMFISQFNESLS